MCTHRGITSISALGLYISLRTLWYEKIIFCGWMGTVPLIIFVDTENSFAHCNFEQNNCEKQIMR